MSNSVEYYDYDFVYQLILQKSMELEEYYDKICNDLIERGILRKWEDIPMEEKYSGEKWRRADTVKLYCPEYDHMCKNFDSLQQEWREFMDETVDHLISINYLGDS